MLLTGESLIQLTISVQSVTVMKPRWQESKTASHPTVKRRGNEHVHLYCVNSLLHSDSSGSKAKNSTTNYLLGSSMPIKDNFLTINILEDIHLSLTLFAQIILDCVRWTTISMPSIKISNNWHVHQAVEGLLMKKEAFFNINHQFCISHSLQRNRSSRWNHVSDKVTQNATSVISVGRDEEITFVVRFINALELL